MEGISPLSVLHLVEITVGGKEFLEEHGVSAFTNVQHSDDVARLHAGGNHLREVG